MTNRGISKPGKKVLLLQGLGCANCAAKIENEVSRIAGVKTASVDFASKRLTIDIDNKDEIEAVVEKAIKISKRIESGINVIDEERKDENEISGDSRKFRIIRLCIGGLLFFAALLIRMPFWVGFGIYSVGYLLVGGKILLRALRNILRGQVFDENFLMAIATIGAFAIGEFPEGVAVMFFYEVGEFFQDIAVNHSRKSISALMDIRPDYANLKAGAEIRKVAPDELGIGDIIIIKPGEKVPVDGKVIDGRSTLDTSALTGESVPREIEAGSDILSGSVNNNGLLTVEVTKEFGESTVSKILDLVENASGRKAPTENFITKFARFYTPAVVFAAAALAVIPPLIVPGASFAGWTNRALVFLVVSCPCALVLSIPLAFFGGIGGASKRGILVKGSNYLEALNNVETMVFDKTGTLTKGIFAVTKVNYLDKAPGIDLLEYAACAESFSNHPIAVSIVKAYGRSIEKSEVADYDEIPGYGIKARVKGKLVLAGNAKLMERDRVGDVDENQTGTVVHIAVEGKYAGNIVISDEIKQDSKSAVKSLRDIGVKRVIMLTGDTKAAGERIGSELGVNEVYSGLLPDQKVERLEAISKQKSPKGKLVFVGDGINDAPVLARADIGIAMGGVGSDAAIEAADIVLMTDEPSKIVDAVKIAKRTRRIVWQNIMFAMSVKAVVLLLGAGGIATIWEAVFADVGVALLAVLNSARVLKTGAPM